MLAQRGMAESVPVVKPRKQAEVHDDQDLTLELAAILLIVSLILSSYYSFCYYYYGHITK